MDYDSIILDLEGTMEKPGTMSMNPRPSGVVLQEGIKEGLDELRKRFPLFIVSNCGPRMLERFLDSHDMRNRFQDWECLGSSGKGKAENILDVIQRNQLKKPVYVGDSFPDAEAAHYAKIDYIHAAYGNDGWLSGAKNFEKFNEIVSYLIS